MRVDIRSEERTMATNRKPPRRDNTKGGRPVSQPAAANEFDYQPDNGPYRKGGPPPEREATEEKGRKGPNRTADVRKRGTAGE
jgi:hypothetical protein